MTHMKPLEHTADFPRHSQQTCRRLSTHDKRLHRLISSGTLPCLKRNRLPTSPSPSFQGEHIRFESFCLLSSPTVSSESPPSSIYIPLQCNQDINYRQTNKQKNPKPRTVPKSHEYTLAMK